MQLLFCNFNFILNLKLQTQSLPTIRDLERGLSSEEAQRILQQLRRGTQRDRALFDNPRDLESSSDEEAANAARRAYNQATTTDQFPVNAELIWQVRDENGDPTRQERVFHTLSEYSPFPTWPNLSLKADVDSLYTINNNFQSLLQSLPTMKRFQMRAHMNPNSKAKGSRFFVNTTDMPNDINVNGHRAKNIPLSMFPNVEIGSVFLKDLDRPMSVYLFNLNVRHIFKEHRFSKLQMAVINAALNIARMESIAACNNDQKTQDEFHDVSFVETKYGPSSRKTINMDFNSYSKKAVLIFSEKFHLALEIIAENNTNVYEFSSHKIHRVRDKEQCTFSRTAMQDFARDLQEGLLFGTTLSGIKKCFPPDQFATVLKKPDEIKAKNSRQLNQNRARITEVINQHIKEAYLALQPNMDQSLIPTHGPSNPLTMDHFPKYRVPYEKVEQFFPDFDEDFHELYKKTVVALMIPLHSFLVNTFTVSLTRPNDIFFDVGLELRMTNQVNVLLHLENTYDEIVSIGSIRK